MGLGFGMLYASICAMMMPSMCFVYAYTQSHIKSKPNRYSPRQVFSFLNTFGIFYLVYKSLEHALRNIDTQNCIACLKASTPSSRLMPYGHQPIPFVCGVRESCVCVFFS